MNLTRQRRRTLLATLLLAVLLAALCATIGTHSAQSASYRECALSSRDQDPPGDKPTYNYNPRAAGASCAVARKVMRGYQGCRPLRGVSCSRKVLGRWSCSGKVTSRIPTQFNADFLCKAGAARVRGSYSQNT